MSKAEIENVNFPEIDELSTTNYQDEEDLKDIVRIWSDCMETDDIDVPITLKEMKNQFDHLTNCDPEEDTLFVKIDGEPVAFSWIRWEDVSSEKQERLYRFQIKVIPEYRGKGITSAIIRWLEQRGREIAEDHPVDKEKLFYMFTSEGEKDLRSTLKSEGYEVYRYGFKMLRPDLEDIPELELPDGVEIRPVKDEHMDKIRLAWNKVCEDLRLQVPISESMWKQWKKDASFDPSLWSIAWHGEEVVGTCFGMINENENKANNTKKGHTELISTQKEWRGQGIAKALIADTLRKLKEAGMEQAALGVDAENPSGALDLYKKMGYEKIGKGIHYHKEMVKGDR